MELTPKNIYLTSKEIGQFVVSRLLGGAYAANAEYLGNLSNEQLDDSANQTNTQT